MSPEPSSAPRHAAIDVAVVIAAFLTIRAIAKAVGLAFVGPVAVVGSVLVIWLVLRLRGERLVDLGFRRPRNTGRAVLINLFSIGAIAVTYVSVLEPAFDALGLPEPEVNRFEYLIGDPLALVLTLVFIAWGTAGVGEEILARGFTLQRLIRAFGNGRTAVAGALLLQAALCGLAHFGSGLRGVLAGGIIGLILSVAYLLGNRNLWCVIPAHAIVDTISLVQLYGSS